MTVLITLAVSDEQAQLIQSRFELGELVDVEFVDPKYAFGNRTDFRARLVGLNLTNYENDD